MKVLGYDFDLDTNEGQRGLMDLIDGCKARGAAGDLSLVAYALLIERTEIRHEQKVQHG